MSSRATLPAVVSIQAGNARGTGFFIRKDAVLTNEHVIAGQSFVELHIGDAKYSARVASVSKATDMAVLQVYNRKPRAAHAAAWLGSRTSASARKSSRSDRRSASSRTP